MQLPSGHPDRTLLIEIANALTDAAGEPARLEQLVGEILRECVDKVIQTPKTGRRLYEELQNTEKTHIGTCVEIDLRSELGFQKGGTQDLEVAGHDVDVKFTGRTAWMIPPEAVGHVCILISANEDSATFTMGVFVAKLEYLTIGTNRDAKKTISAAGRSNIHWMFKDAPYPKNFWLTVSQEVANKIAAGRSGNERMMTLFREVLDRPISRKVVADVAGQLDFTRRVRKDGSRGTRNQLASEGILVLSGTQARDQEFIGQIGLPRISRTEYLAHRLNGDEVQVARSLGFEV
jgi:hypothetical protein